MSKEALFQSIEEQTDGLFQMACDIFDHPEIGCQEFFASKLLADALEAEGFQVERGVADLETAFRATWSHGEGGPNIGILGEYDALAERGHGCGHHLQTPAAIGAAVSLKRLYEALDLSGADGANTPFTITIYGTPAEETIGGKILMAKKGCFEELDIALGTHACTKTAFIGDKSFAIRSFQVTFRGKNAHACAAWGGRSAADAMILSFNGIEFLREHVKEDTRMHYAISETYGPTNVVPATAKAKYTLRSKDNKYLAELEERFRKLIQGACLMTETEAEIVRNENMYAARKSNLVLAETVGETFEMMDMPVKRALLSDSGGSTDFGNVSTIVPSALIYIPYFDAPSHSEEWVQAGKTDAARACLTNSAKALAGTMYDLILRPELVKKAREEFELNE